MNIRFIQAALVSTMLLGGCVYADRPYDDRPHAAGPGLSASFVFSERERIYLRDHYHRNLPPGLAKQGKVPPGHAKRLQRGMPWPPGVHYEPLPPHLEHHLQPLPRGYARFLVGPDVVIVDLGARLIVDGFHLGY
ncbi:MAG: hypothetical protein FNT29_06515 [Halothiobacillaceae bacterium]|nr:MAG: hypothetical protein FNT29_06515 [Halothiobacillaceae bacterium]